MVSKSGAGAWTLWLGILGVLVLGGAGVLVFQTLNGSSREASSNAPSEQRSDSVEPTSHSVTSRDRYLLSYAFFATREGSEFLSLKMEGELELGELTTVPSEHVLRGAFQGALQLSQAGEPAPAAGLERLERDLGQPFFASYQPSGQLESLRLSPGLERIAQTTLRGVMTALQFVRSGAESAAWEIEESDASGRYLAEYRERTEDADPARPAMRTYDKKKLRYLGSTGGASTEVLESNTRFVWLGDALREVHLVERVKVGASSGAAESLGRFEGQLRVDLVWQGKLEGRVGADQYKSFELLGLDVAGTRQATERELDQAVAAGYAFPQVMAHLMRPGTTNEEKQAWTKAYRALASMVRLDPQHVAELERRIRERQAEMNTWISGLRDAGTPEAQAALVRLLDVETFNENERLDLARALSLVTQPTPETTAALRALVADAQLGEQAVLGLGSHVRRLAEGGQDAAPLLDELVRGVRQAKTPAEQDRYLTALGNAGQRDALPVIDEVLAGTVNSVKAEAVHALRRIPGDDVDARLIAQLSSPDVQTRRQAARAIRDRERTPALEAALAKALRTEPHILVESTLIQTSALWAKGSEVIRAALAWVAENSEHENLRHQASAALRAAGG